MDCLAVRDRLELREAAAVVGLALPRVEPPAPLEDKVVRRVRTSSSPHPSRRRVVALRTVTLFAAVVALLGLGLAGALFARQQPLQSKLSQSQHQAHRFAERFNALLRSFPGQASQPHDISRATLAPPGSGRGGGGAIRVTSSRFEDIAVVIVGGLAREKPAYKVWLVGSSGRRLFVGDIHVDSGGGGETADQFSADLGRFRSVEVRDAKGKMVLSGAFSLP
jgi:hypothetical protein